MESITPLVPTMRSLTFLARSATTWWYCEMFSCDKSRYSCSSVKLFMVDRDAVMSLSSSGIDHLYTTPELTTILLLLSTMAFPLRNPILKLNPPYKLSNSGGYPFQAGGSAYRNHLNSRGCPVQASLGRGR